MRGRLGRLFVLIAVGLSLVGASGVPTSQSTTVSQETATKLDELDHLLDQLIGLLQPTGPGTGDVADKLSEVRAAFSQLLRSFPSVYGVPFDELFASLFAIGTRLNDAGRPEEEGLWGLYDDSMDVSEARRVKEGLEWALAGAQLQGQSQCLGGRVLVVAYPGFDCHQLRTTIQGLLDAGKCVVVTWREAAGHKVSPTDAGDPTPTAARVLDCLQNQFNVGPRFSIQEVPASAESSYPDVRELGDVTASVHASPMPTSPHSAYDDSALATDVTRGVPTRIDPNRPFDVGEVIKPWYAVDDLCSPVDIEWRYYDPMGSLVRTETQTLNPADYGTGCLSNFSSAGWLPIDPSFATGGMYAAELWIGGTYSALHRFTVVGGAPQPPIVNNDFYAMDEDTVYNATDYPLTTNDIDPNYDPLAVSLVEGPRHGTLDLSTDGAFVYVPDKNYYGVDWFTYSASDPGGLSSTGQATILVNPVNDAPTAVDDLYDIFISSDGTSWTVSSPDLEPSMGGTFVEDGEFITIPAPGALFNDTDPDNDPLTLRLAGPLPPEVSLFPDGSLAIPISVPDLPKSYSIAYFASDPLGLESPGQVEIVIRQEGGGS